MVLKENICLMDMQVGYRTYGVRFTEAESFRSTKSHTYPNRFVCSVVPLSSEVLQGISGRNAGL